MMIKKLAAVFCFVQIAYSAPSPYQYNTFTTGSSTPSSYNAAPTHNTVDAQQKYSVGYKVQDTPSSNKVKKEYNNADYPTFFIPSDASGKPPLPAAYSHSDFTSFDNTYSTTAASVTPFPYNPAKLNTVAPNVFVQPFAKGFALPPPPPPSTAAAKAFIHHDDHKVAHPLVHNLVGHYLTDVASHKLKHAGEALQSGAYNEPIIHKLSFAKAALIQLLALLGPLSAIKTVHVLSHSSDPHHHHHHSAPEHEIPPPVLAGPAGEHVQPYAHHHPYPSTLVQIILNFVAHLSKFNAEATLHLIPNLLKLVSHASSSSTHVSGHHPH